jgi:hypothetical protein
MHSYIIKHDDVICLRQVLKLMSHKDTKMSLQVLLDTLIPDVSAHTCIDGT